MNVIDTPYAIYGDASIFNRVYIAFQGSSARQINFLLGRDLDPASNDNSPVGLAKVG